MATYIAVVGTHKQDISDDVAEFRANNPEAANWEVSEMIEQRLSSIAAKLGLEEAEGGVQDENGNWVAL